MKIDEVTQRAGKAFGRAFRSVKRYALFERVLAVLCLLIPAVLIAADGSTRDSISAYHDMIDARAFYVPLTIAAMMFVVNGVVNRGHFYNTALGVALFAVIIFDMTTARVPHYAGAGIFFAGNVLVIFGSEVSNRFKSLYGASLAVAVVFWLRLDAFTTFWAEWLALLIIAAHYYANASSKLEYEAMRRGRGRRRGR
jgi:hypothetical protein